MPESDQWNGDDELPTPGPRESVLEEVAASRNTAQSNTVKAENIEKGKAALDEKSDEPKEEAKSSSKEAKK